MAWTSIVQVRCREAGVAVPAAPGFVHLLSEFYRKPEAMSIRV
jgi:hypothetical protein